MHRRLLAIGTILLVASCASTPSAPPSYEGDVPASVDGDPVVIDQLMARSKGMTYPPKYYWNQPPTWVEDTSEMGIVVGRHTTGMHLVEIRRFDAYCTIRRVSVKQKKRGDDFAAAQIKGGEDKRSIDCSVYDAGSAP